MEVLKYLISLQEVDEVYVDGTRGINHMPILAKDAVILALSVYSIRRGKGVKLFVYNSDPIEEGATLNVNEIERYTLNVRRQLII